MNLFAGFNDEARVWMRGVMAEIGNSDGQESLRTLGAGLKAIRDQLTLREAAELGAHLPLLVRGIFFEDWNPDCADARSASEVLANLRRRCSASAARADLAAVLRVMERQVMEATPQPVVNEKA